MQGQPGLPGRWLLKTVCIIDKYYKTSEQVIVVLSPFKLGQRVSQDGVKLAMKEARELGVSR